LDEFEGLGVARQHSFERAVDLHDVGVIMQGREIGGFRRELPFGALAQIRQNFDGDVTIQFGVAAEQHLPETAGP
jgi:hypothetical protein